MGPAALGSVNGRIAAIEAQFAPPAAGFGAALRAATRAGTVAAPMPPKSPSEQPGGEPAVRAAARPSSPPSPAATAPVVAGAPPGGFAGGWAAGLPAAGRTWAPAIERAALRAGIDPALLGALVWAESGFRPQACSHAGAIGLTQLMPTTADGLGVDPHDPEQNLAGGARYLAEQLDRFGRPDLALAAYNAGPGRVARAGGIPDIAETRAYVPRVLDYHQRLGGTR